MKQKLAGMTGAAIDDEAGDIDDMNDEDNDEDNDESAETPESNAKPA
jgi:hypothetical protein